MDHRAFGSKLKPAQAMREQGITSTRIAAILDVSPQWVRKWTSSAANKAPRGRPREFDHDRAFDLIERQGLPKKRVARLLRVSPSGVRTMVKRRKS